jgi:hypothetical protein
LNAIKQGVVTSTTRDAMRDAEAEIDELREEITRAEKWRVPGILPGAVARYQQAIEQLEERLGDRVEPAREILRSLLGDRVRIHRKGEHLEAEIPNQVRALLAKSLNERVDSGGCGGGMCNESTWVSLKATPADSMPLRHRTQDRLVRPKNPAA